jgi:transcription elongation factor Elf1
MSMNNDLLIVTCPKCSKVKHLMERELGNSCGSIKSILSGEKRFIFCSSCGLSFSYRLEGRYVIEPYVRPSPGGTA